jgi:hypothetical protein
MVMAYEQTKDVLERARGFHHKLAELYRQMGESTGKPRLKLLLEYMSRHEAGLEACLQGYEKLADRRVLDTWFQFTPGSVPEQPCPDFDPDAGLSVGEVVRMALEFDACLLRYYEQLVEEAPSDELRDLFQELLECGKREAVELSRSALEVEQL